MTAGTLMAGDGLMGAVLCDTDLYMNLGDHDGTIDDCLGSLNYATATFGLAWNVGGNNGCNFDDPPVASLGPTSQCGFCAPGTDQLEEAGYGFGAVLGLNTGTIGTGENHIAVFIR
jgi:hypothetical protein